GVLGREVIVTDALSGKSRRSPAGHAGPVTALHFDGQRLRTAGADGKVVTWDRSGRPLGQSTLSDAPQQGGIGGLGCLGGGGRAFPLPEPNPVETGGMKMEFSPSGRWVVSEKGKVYDLKADESRFDEVGELSGGPGAVCISRGDVLFVAGVDK